MTSCRTVHTNTDTCHEIDYINYTRNQLNEVEIELDILRDTVGNSMIEVLLTDYTNVREQIKECHK